MAEYRVFKGNHNLLCGFQILDHQVPIMSVLLTSSAFTSLFASKSL